MGKTDQIKKDAKSYYLGLISKAVHEGKDRFAVARELNQLAKDNDEWCDVHNEYKNKGEMCHSCEREENERKKRKAEFDDPSRLMIKKGLPRRVCLEKLTMDDFQYLDEFEYLYNYSLDPQGDLVLYGIPGNGKTTLACAIAREQIRRLKPVEFIYLPNLFAQLKNSFKNDEVESEWELLNRYNPDHLLIIDDLGTEYQTDWTRALLDLIIDNRYRDMKPTIITTNLTARTMFDMSPRIESRLRKFRWVLTGKEDRR